jgi:hypothetical protein
MQLHLVNTLTKFQNSICKTLDVNTNEKTILIARLTKKRKALKREKIHSPLINLQLRILK